MQEIINFELMAKLCFKETEREFASACADTLTESFEELKKIDTKDAVPLVTVLDIKNVLREDTVVKHISTEELLSNAPEQYGGYFQAPKTLD